MKKLLIAFLFTALLGISTVKAETLTFEEAYSVSDKKPMLVLVYANWADNYENYVKQFEALIPDFEENFNFVEMDIADKGTKAFNEKYHIYPNLPYVLMFRNGGKISRYIPRDCAASVSCMIPKVKSFIQ